jgi:hypothetical protein
MQLQQKKNIAVIQRSGMTEQQLRAITSSGRVSPVTASKRKIDDVLSEIDTKNGSSDSLFAVRSMKLTSLFLLIVILNLDANVK